MSSNLDEEDQNLNFNPNSDEDEEQTSGRIAAKKKKAKKKKKKQKAKKAKKGKKSKRTPAEIFESEQDEPTRIPWVISFIETTFNSKFQVDQTHAVKQFEERMEQMCEITDRDVQVNNFIPLTHDEENDLKQAETQEQVQTIFDQYIENVIKSFDNAKSQNKQIHDVIFEEKTRKLVIPEIFSLIDKSFNDITSFNLNHDQTKQLFEEKIELMRGISSYDIKKGFVPLTHEEENDLKQAETQEQVQDVYEKYINNFITMFEEASKRKISIEHIISWPNKFVRLIEHLPKPFNKNLKVDTSKAKLMLQENCLNLCQFRDYYFDDECFVTFTEQEQNRLDKIESQEQLQAEFDKYTEYIVNTFYTTREYIENENAKNDEENQRDFVSAAIDRLITAPKLIAWISEHIKKTFKNKIKVDFTQAVQKFRENTNILDKFSNYNFSVGFMPLTLQEEIEFKKAKTQEDVQACLESYIDNLITTFDNNEDDIRNTYVVIQDAIMNKNKEKELLALSKSKEFDKYICITIRCKEYGNRKQIATKRKKGKDGVWFYETLKDENDKPLLKQIWNDLPGTLKDEKEFDELLENLNIPEEDWTKIKLQEPTPKQINEALLNAQKMIQQNFDHALKTFLIVFYAGHGAMKNNQQVLILNGEEVEKKKSIFNKKESNSKTKEWSYIYEIEQQLKNKCTYFGDFVYTWAIFDCCKSLYKENEALLEEEINQLQQDDQDEQENNDTRGTGEKLSCFNHLFINGCQANSVIKDDNTLVLNIIQELRKNQKNNTVSFPTVLNDLPRIFPDCIIQSSTNIEPAVPYISKIFKKLNIDLDSIHVDKTAKKEVKTGLLNSQYDSQKLEFQDFVEDNEGWYWGTIVNGQKEGFGRYLFKENVNHHPVIMDQSGDEDANYNYNYCNYVYYEGNFKKGQMTGQGILKLQGQRVMQSEDSEIEDQEPELDERVLIGEFQNNQFTGFGYEYNQDCNGQQYVAFGNYKNGQPHGKNRRKDDGYTVQGIYDQNQLTGTSLQTSETYSNSIYAQYVNGKPQGLGVQKLNGSIKTQYCGQFGSKINLGKMTDPLQYNYTAYKGQFLNVSNTLGFGELKFKDGSRYQGFFYSKSDFDPKRHGIGKMIKNGMDQSFHVYNKNNRDEKRDLTLDEVQAINNGTMEIPEMEVFFQKRYSDDEHPINHHLGYQVDSQQTAEGFIWKEANERLDFNWIKNKGVKILLVVDDFYELAYRNRLVDHTLDEGTEKQLEQMEKERDAIYNSIDEKIDNFIKFKDATKAKQGGKSKETQESDSVKVINNLKKENQEAIDKLTKENQQTIDQLRKEKNEAQKQAFEALKKQEQVLKTLEELKQKMAEKNIQF